MSSDLSTQTDSELPSSNFPVSVRKKVIQVECTNADDDEPSANRKAFSSARKSLGKSMRDSLLVSLQQQKASPAPSRRVSHAGVNPDEEQMGEDSTVSSKRASTLSSFSMIPSLRNSLRSSIKSDRNGFSKDLEILRKTYNLVSVKDFGYLPSAPLHAGIANYELYLHSQRFSDSEDYERQDFEIGKHDDSEQDLEKVVKAIALFDFEAENDNELELRENQQIYILYKHGNGWLVGEDPQTGATGLLPEEYVQFLAGEDDAQPVEEAQEEGEDDQGSNDENEEGRRNNDGANEEREHQGDHDSYPEESEGGNSKDGDGAQDVFYNASSQLTSPIDGEFQHNEIDARTTQITESPLSHDHSDNDNESNYTLINNRRISVQEDSNDQITNQVTSSNYIRFLANSSTTPVTDKTADSSSSDKFSNELESETSDLQIDNGESKPFLPDMFRANSANSNSLSNSPMSLSNSASYPRFHKRSLSNIGSNSLFFVNNNGNSSGANSLINDRSGLPASSSFNSNLNFNLTFGSGSPTTAVLTGQHRRGSILFGSGLIQSKSTNSINLKMGTVSSLISIPRSTSLTKALVNEDFEGLSKLDTPNLLSKDNYFLPGGANNNVVNTTSVLMDTYDDSPKEEDFWIDEEFKRFEKKFDKPGKKEQEVQEYHSDSNITPVTSVPVTLTPNEVSNHFGNLLTSKLPKSFTMRNISDHRKSLNHQGQSTGEKKTGFKALGRKLSKMRLKMN